MQGDFTRDTFSAGKNYNRVRKQQGRVDLDSDFNEQADILLHRNRTEAIDVIGRSGVPIHDAGFGIEVQGGELVYTPGRIYVDGILCEAHETVALTDQPGFTLPVEPGTYIAYLDVWDRHITAIDDPSIKEVALGGPDTASRVQTAFQVRLHRVAQPPPFGQQACIPFPAPAANGRLAARTDPAVQPDNPCVVGAEGGYRGLENRLYRVEIHDDGRDAAGGLVRPILYKWSRDNGSVVLEIAAGGIDDERVSVLTLGPDSVLTVSIGDWVEVVGETDDLSNRAGILAQVLDIEPGGDDFPVLILDRTVAAAAGQNALKVRRWDQKEMAAAPLTDGARAIHGGFVGLEDGVEVKFDSSLFYRVGDYWLIPARTRTGNIEWPAGTAWVERHGILHHYSTLGMVLLGGDEILAHDCRDGFPPLTEIDQGSCCITVHPGEDIQAAVDRAVAEGGGCVELCSGVHRLPRPLRFESTAYVTLKGCGIHSRVLYTGGEVLEDGAIVIRQSVHLHFKSFFLLAEGVRSLIHVAQEGNSRNLAFEELTLIHGDLFGGAVNQKAFRYGAGILLAGTREATVEKCRIAAPIGIAAALGDGLPQLPDLLSLVREATGALSGRKDATAAAMRFEDFSAFERTENYRVDDSAASGGVTLAFRLFTWSNGETYSDGYAESRVLGGGKGLWTNNILPVFSRVEEFRQAAFAYEYHGGNLNVVVDGVLLNADKPQALDGQTVAGASLRVEPATAGNFDQGILYVTSDTALDEVGFGGQELGLVGFALGTSEDPGSRADWGRSVSRLRLTGCDIRHSAVGLLACVLEDSELEKTSFRSLPDFGKETAFNAFSPFAKRGFAEDFLAKGSGEFGEPALLGQIDDVIFGAPPRDQKGVGVAAWILERVGIKDCSMVSRQGLIVAFAWENRWLRNAWRCGDVCITTGAVADTRLHLSELESPGGIGVIAAISKDFTVSQCGIRAATGIASGTLGALIRLLGDILNYAALGLHGAQDEASVRGLLWLLLGETGDRLGLSSWFRELDALAGPFLPQGVPDTLAAVAVYLEALLRQDTKISRSFETLGLVHMGLTVRDCRIESTRTAIQFRDFIPLGAIRIEGNRIVSTEGRGVELLAHRLAAHPALIQELVLKALALGAEILKKLGDRLPPFAGLSAAVAATLGEWLAAARRCFTAEASITRNNILSAATAVDTNLYEAIVARNHITLSERADVVRRAGGARLFGSVRDQSGRPVAGVTVSLAGTSHATLTNADGAYQLADLPPGTYAASASANGYFPSDPASVALVPSEARTLDFNLRSRNLAVWNFLAFGGETYSPYVNVHAHGPAAAVNAQTGGLIAALEDADVFLELADGLREGAYVDPVSAGEAVAENLDRASAEDRSRAIAALGKVLGATDDGEIQARTLALREGLTQPPGDGSREAALAWASALMRLVDSRGILVRSPGCSLVENRIVVAQDERADTEALGGIQVTVDLRDLFLLALLDVLLDAQLEDGAFESPETDTLVERLLRAIPPTSIRDNEISRGVGHGIALYGALRRPEFLRAVSIKGNTIAGLANAGIWVGEATMIIDLAIQDNRVESCGNRKGLSQSKGGIRVQTAAQVDCSRNRVVSCGAGESVSALGVELSAIIDLQCLGNSISGNGGERKTTEDGGLRLRHIAGATQVLHNRVEDNRGVDFLWDGDGQGKVDFNPALAAFLKRFPTGVAEIRAIFAHNEVSRGSEGLSPPATLRDQQDLALNGNRIGGASKGLALLVAAVQRLSLQNNMLSGGLTIGDAPVSAIVQNVKQGLAVGNISDGHIKLQGSTLITAQNIPATIN